MVFLFCGCDKSNVSDAYSILESKETQKVSDGNRQGDYYDIADKGVKVSNDADTVSYNNFTIKVQNVWILNSIFDLSEEISGKELDEFYDFLIARGIGNDGKAKGNRNKLLAISCKIKNDTSEDRRVDMHPNFYCLKEDNTFGIASGGVLYGWYGVYEPTSMYGYDVFHFYYFKPQEEIDTIAVFSFDERTLVENNYYSIFDKNVSAYMSATFFSNFSSTSELPKGDYLAPIMIKGEPVR